MWGAISYFLLFSFSIFVLAEYAYGPFRAVVFPFLVIYGACLTVLWFFLLAKWHVYSWFGLAVGTIFYFWFIDTFLFLPLGAFEGNGLFFPLLSFIQIPWLLWSVSYVSLYGVLLLLCISSLFVAYSLAFRNIYYCSGALSIYIFFFLGYFIQHKEEKPLWLSCVGVVQLNNAPGLQGEQAQSAVYALLDLCAKYPDIKSVFFPESQFPYPLNMHKKTYALFYDNVVSSGIVLCCGAYRLEKEKLYNSLYVMAPNQSLQWHDKEHLCYFTEYVPSVWSWIPGVSSLFFSSQQCFTQSTCTRKPIIVPSVGFFVPYLCSELLLANRSRDSYDSMPILCLANDSWFCGDYMPRLMVWQAQLKALVWKRQVLYVAYHYAVWIDSYGNTYELQT